MGLWLFINKMMLIRKKGKFIFGIFIVMFIFDVVKIIIIGGDYL